MSLKVKILAVCDKLVKYGPFYQILMKTYQSALVTGWGINDARQGVKFCQAPFLLIWKAVTSVDVAAYSDQGYIS